MIPFALIGKVGLDTGGLDAELAKVRQGLSSVSSAAQLLTGAIGVGGLAAALSSLGSTSLELSQKFENLDRSFQMALATWAISAGKANDLQSALKATSRELEIYQSWVTEVAKASPFERADVQSVFQNVLFGGAAPEQAQRMTKAMLDFATATGKSGETLNLVGYALQQIMTSGRLLGQDLRQLTNAGINMWQALAQYYGMTVEEVRKLQEEGKISSGEALEALAQYLEKFYGGATEIAAGTTQGLRSTFAELKELAARELTGPIAEKMKEALQKLIIILEDPRLSELLKNIGAGLGQMFDILLKPLDLVGRGLDWLLGVVSRVNPEVIQLATTVGGLSAVFGVLGISTVQLLPLVLKLGTTLLSFFGPGALIAAGIAAVVFAVILFKDELMDLGRKGAEALRNLGEQGGRWLAENIKLAVNKVVEAINWMVEKVVGGLNWLIDQLNRIPGVSIGKIEWKPIEVDWDKLAQDVRTGMASVGGWFREGWDSLSAYTKGAWDDLSSYLGDKLSGIGDFLKGKFLKPELTIGDEMRDLKTKMRETGAEGSASFLEGFSSGLAGSDEADKAVKDMMGRIKRAVDSAREASKGLLDLSTDWIKPGANGPFENIYRALDVAKLGEKSPWAQALGLTKEQAEKVMRDFQNGLMSPEVIGLIDIPALVERIKQEQAAEASQEAFAEMLAKAAGVDKSVVEKVLGMPGGQKASGEKMGSALQEGVLSGFKADTTITSIIAATEESLGKQKERLKESGKVIAAAIGEGVKAGAPGIVDILLNALLPGIREALNWNNLQNGNLGYVP